jgi:hypothetical protein
MMRDEEADDELIQDNQNGRVARAGDCDSREFRRLAYVETSFG